MHQRTQIWRGCSVVKRPCCSSRGSKVGFRNPINGLQPPETSASGDLTPPPGLLGYLHSDTQMKININLFVKESLRFNKMTPILQGWELSVHSQKYSQIFLETVIIFSSHFYGIVLKELYFTNRE